jgi:hypothetical protein
MIDENGACFCMDAGIDIEIDDFDSCWRSPLLSGLRSLRKI